MTESATVANPAHQFEGLNISHHAKNRWLQYFHAVDIKQQLAEAKPAGAKIQKSIKERSPVRYKESYEPLGVKFLRTTCGAIVAVDPEQRIVDVFPVEFREPPLFKSHRLGADGQVVPWPRMPKAPKFTAPARPRRRPGVKVTPHDDERPEPLERLCRLAGGSTYKVPTVGKGTRRGMGGVDDLAHALGMVGDDLEQALALALACQSNLEWPSIQKLAYPRLQQAITGRIATRWLVDGPRKFRIRIVLQDVFYDLTSSRPAQSMRAAAAAVHMREQAYRELYKAIEAYLETWAKAGAHRAIRALFGGN